MVIPANSSQNSDYSIDQTKKINNVLHDISRAINESTKLEDLYLRIHSALGKIIDVTNFYIALYQSEKNTVTFPFYIDSFIENKKTGVYELNKMKGSLTALVISTGEAFLKTKSEIQQYLKEKNYPPFGHLCEIWLGAPLYVQGNVIGVIAIQDYHNSNAYSKDDLNLLNMVSDHVALAIELKLKEQSLKNSESRYRNLVEKINEVIYLTDAAGNIIYISPVVGTLLGLAPEEVTGSKGIYRYQVNDDSSERTNFKQFIYQDDLEKTESLFKIAYKDLKPFQLEYRIKTKEGKLNWVIEKGHFFCDQTGDIRLEGMILNNQERKRAEMINQSLYNISNAVSSTADLDDLYHTIHQSLGLVLNVDNFYIALYNNEEDTITFPYKKDLKDPSEIWKITAASQSTSLTSVVIRNRKPLFLTKEKSYKLVKEMGGEHIGEPAEIWLGVPLMCGSEVIGAMGLQSYDYPTLYSEEDSDILISVSEQVATAIIRKRAEVALEETQEKLIESARKAGMAEIASGTLHNVGNILNSVKVSADLINSINRESTFFRFQKANELLKSNFDNLENFILNDPKGKRLLKYYIRLETTFEFENQQIQEQVYMLHEKIQLMTDIIFDQQDFAGGKILLTENNADEVVDNVLKMQANMLSNHHIHVIKQYNPTCKIRIHKTKFMHVLINLVKNAKDSMLIQPEDNRKLTVSIGQAENQVHIAVEDNGEGILPEVEPQLFKHGFTTKKDGHGFGLHNSVIYMEEMEGEIRLESKGPRQGAIFTLIVPGSC